MEDCSKTIDEAKKIVEEFCECRDWGQFHNPKDLAIGVVTESSELLQIFRFKTPAECEAMLSNIKSKQKICDEISDVFFFVLRFAQKFDIDLYSSLLNKIMINNKKYPIDQSKGCNKKYDEY